MSFLQHKAFNFILLLLGFLSTYHGKLHSWAIDSTATSSWDLSPSQPGQDTLRCPFLPPGAGQPGSGADPAAAEPLPAAPLRSQRGFSSSWLSLLRRLGLLTGVFPGHPEITSCSGGVRRTYGGHEGRCCVQGI